MLSLDSHETFPLRSCQRPHRGPHGATRIQVLNGHIDGNVFPMRYPYDVTYPLISVSIPMGLIGY